MKTVLVRSVVRAHNDPKHQNKRVSFEDESIPRINSIGDVEDDNQIGNDEVIASRTRSKTRFRGALHTRTIMKGKNDNNHKAIDSLINIPSIDFFYIWQPGMWIISHLPDNNYIIDEPMYSK